MISSTQHLIFGAYEKRKTPAYQNNQTTKQRSKKIYISNLSPADILVIWTN